MTHLKMSETSKDMRVTHNSTYNNAKYLTTYLLQNFNDVVVLYCVIFFFFSGMLVKVDKYL